MLNKCDFETSIVVILLPFRFNHSKSICLGLGYGIFHTQNPAVSYTKGFVILFPCVETPNEPVRCDHSGFSDIH